MLGRYKAKINDRNENKKVIQIIDILLDHDILKISLKSISSNLSKSSYVFILMATIK